MLASRTRRAIADPGQAVAWLAARLTPGRYLDRLVRQARRTGFCRPTFVLSLDCDTDRDTAVLAQLHARLRSAGVSPAYAAAGEVMLAAPDIYRDLARDGAELLNHGYRRHAAFDPSTGEVVSTLFYENMPPDEWRIDVRRGHDAVADIAGRPPRGFRAPHFGSLAASASLEALWSLLADMGYVYSSSTGPLTGWRHGPAFQGKGVLEIPLSGCLDQPAQIVDSWGLVRTGEDGSRPLVTALVRYQQVMQADVPLLLNMYLDPADIAEDDAVLSALATFAPFDRGGFDGVIAVARRA